MPATVTLNGYLTRYYRVTGTDRVICDYLEIVMSATVKINGFTVQRYGIAGTETVVCDVWEPYAGHSTYRHGDDGAKLGRIGTRPLSPDLDALPAYSEERSVKVGAWHDRQYGDAYRLILVTFPDMADGYASMGSITRHGQRDTV